MSDQENVSNIPALATSVEDENSTEWVDITGLIHECAASLSVDDPFLCDQSSFSLHDAMAATQLADRKMDCCEIPIRLVAPHGKTLPTLDNDITTFPRPTPTGLDGEFTPLPWDELTIIDSLFIGVNILVRMQSLLSGASVGESTFTCLYAHSPVLADMELRLFPNSLSKRLDRLMVEYHKPEGTTAQMMVFAFTLALVETTQVVRGIIQNADIYEEEDFVASTNQIPFWTEHHEVDTLQVLEVAVSIAETSLLADERPEVMHALQCILRFQLGFLTVISVMVRLSGSIHGLDDAMEICTFTHARDFLFAIAMQAKLSSDTIPTAVLRMKEIANISTAKLQSLAMLVEDLQSKEGVAESVQGTIHLSFDSYVNRPLVGNAPVRKVFFREPKEAINLLQSIVHELEWAVCDTVLLGTSLGRIHRILDRLAPSNVNIVVRSLIVLNLYFDDKIFGQHTIRQLILQDMRQWSHIPESLMANEHSQNFLNRLAKPIYDTMKLKCLNKNRQRAYIEVVMLPEWLSLQNEAHVVDAHYQQTKISDSAPPPPHFSHYVLTVVIRLMERFVASGVELGLFYSHEELSYANWYRDYLLSALLNNLNTMKRTKAIPPSKGSDKSVRNTGRGGRGRKKTPHSKAKGSPTVADSTDAIVDDIEDDLELTALMLKRNLCRGTIRFLAALRQAGYLKPSNYEFSSIARIFNERFHAFEKIRQPPPLMFEHYVEGSDFSGVNAHDLVSSTVEWFQSCRRTVDQLLFIVNGGTIPAEYGAVNESEIRALLKVCVGNAVYLQKLQQSARDPHKEVKVDFDFSSHEQFCIIRLS